MAGTWAGFLQLLCHSCCPVNVSQVPKEPGVGVRHGEGTCGLSVLPRGQDKVFPDWPCHLVKGGAWLPHVLLVLSC